MEERKVKATLCGGLTQKLLASRLAIDDTQRLP